MEQNRTAQAVATLVTTRRQVENLRDASTESYEKWVLSHLTTADRELIETVTGEIITSATVSASEFAMQLAESRIGKTESRQVTTSPMFMTRPLNMTQHDRVATFATMRSMVSTANLGSSIDITA